MALQSTSLKRFLLQNLYRHPQVLQTTQAAQQVVRDLFDSYMADPAEMPQAHIDRFDGIDSIDSELSPSARPERVVADYIAGSRATPFFRFDVAKLTPEAAQNLRAALPKVRAEVC